LTSASARAASKASAPDGAGERAQLHEGHGVSLLRHDAADPGLGPFHERERRLRVPALRGDVGHEDPDRQRTRAGDPDRLGAAVHRRDLVRIERVLHDAVEAEQFGETGPADREAGGAQRGGAERRPVQTPQACRKRSASRPSASA
jgi:hypothetical protein